MRIGDWEADTVVSKDHLGGVATAVCRSSRFLVARQVQMQFLTEAITITQLGGLLGILLGVGIGSLVGLAIGAPFFIPWEWVGLGIAVCLVVGVLAGWYPARKASKLDPIDALRYE